MASARPPPLKCWTYQNNLTAARSQEIRALANYNEALANLAQQEGSTLERYNINIEAK